MAMHQVHAKTKLRKMWSDVDANYSHWKYLSMFLCKHILKEIHFVMYSSKFWHNASKIISIKLAYYYCKLAWQRYGQWRDYEMPLEKNGFLLQEILKFSLCPILKEEIFIINYIFIRTISILFASSLSSKWRLGKLL